MLDDPSDDDGTTIFDADEPADAADPTEAKLDDALRSFGVDPDDGPIDC